VREPFPDAGWFGPLLQFQRHAPQALNQPETQNGEYLFAADRDENKYLGRDRPLLANSQLFLRWKELCGSLHGEICGNYYTGRRTSRLRFIDVVDRCVVDSPSNDQTYVALSYVWGKANLPRLTASTKEEYRRTGSLTENNLPRVIADALKVTNSLNERYLWVDCLCIMQDDEADKLEFIPQMDSIFGFAAVTIVAACGNDAHTGLAGVTPGSRAQKQDKFSLKGIQLISSAKSMLLAIRYLRKRSIGCL